MKMKTEIKPSAIFYAVAIFMVALGFSSCQKEASSGTNMSANTTSNATSLNAATTSTTVFDFPGGFTFFVDCINDGQGDSAVVSGTTHLIITNTVNKNNYVLKIVGASYGTAYAITTGEQFLARGSNITTQQGSFINGQARTSYVNSFSLIGKGGTESFYVEQIINLVINADGTVTASVDKETAYCK